jgi:hypothetical protein
MSYALINGRRFRILNVIDVLSREALAGEVDSGLSARPHQHLSRTHKNGSMTRLGEIGSDS